MVCVHAAVEAPESAFFVDSSRLVSGVGALSEVGAHAAALGMRRAALFTDRRVAQLPWVARAREALSAAGVEAVLFAACEVEPTDASFLEAAAFLRDAKVDGAVSVGGGSVIDTCKAALLYASFPAPFLTYVNAPIGEGKPVPGPLPQHIACPTTCGTGSECTAIAVCDILSLGVKTGIASKALRPSLAIVDPACTATLPSSVVAASGFDVLCHALESLTARPFWMLGAPVAFGASAPNPFGSRQKPASPGARPLSQGSNPWSDMGSLEALRLGGRYFVRAVQDATDTEARHGLSWAATLAGIAFGNAGVHLPHAMSYAVAGLVRDFRMEGYPKEHALVPHGISVIVNAPPVFRLTAAIETDGCPACVDLANRHLRAAEALGADVRGAGLPDAGEVLSARIAELMRAANVPNGLLDLGYTTADLAALAARAAMQKRLLDNAPRPTDEAALKRLFEGALRAW